MTYERKGGSGGLSQATADATYAPLGSIFINVLDHGVKGDGSTDDTDAFATALSAAATAKRPLYIPGGTYKITAQLDWSGDNVVIQGAGSGLVTIKQYTDNTGIVLIGGGNQQSIGGIRFSYANTQTSSDTGAIAIAHSTDGAAFLSHYYDLRIENAATAWQLPTTGSTAGLFSCLIENIRILGYAITALDWDVTATDENNTGCVLNNIYIHNNPDGEPNTATGYALNMRGWDEAVINQLNIEHGTYGLQPVFFSQAGRIVVNSLHLEDNVYNDDGHGVIYVSHDTNLTINGLTSRFNTYSSGKTSLPFFEANYAATLVVNGMAHDSNTVSSTAHPILTFGSSATAIDVFIRGAAPLTEFTTPYFTGTANGLRVRELNAPMTPINAQTGSYTLAEGDEGCRVAISNSSANTLTVPLNATVGFPIGAEVEIFQAGSGQTTIAAASGVTLESLSSALKISGQYGSAVLTKVAADTWTVVGALTS